MANRGEHVKRTRLEFLPWSPYPWRHCWSVRRFRLCSLDTMRGERGKKRGCFESDRAYNRLKEPRDCSTFSVSTSRKSKNESRPALSDLARETKFMEPAQTRLTSRAILFFPLNSSKLEFKLLSRRFFFF